jgi:hypothetical protein
MSIVDGELSNNILYLACPRALFICNKVECTRAIGGWIVVLRGSEYFQTWPVPLSPHQNKLPPWESVQYVTTLPDRYGPGWTFNIF